MTISQQKNDFHNAKLKFHRRKHAKSTSITRVSNADSNTADAGNEEETGAPKNFMKPCKYCGHVGKHWIGMTGDMKPHFCVVPECGCERCPDCGSTHDCPCAGDDL